MRRAAAQATHRSPRRFGSRPPTLCLGVCAFDARACAGARGGRPLPHLHLRAAGRNRLPIEARARLSADAQQDRDAGGVHPRSHDEEPVLVARDRPADARRQEQDLPRPRPGRPDRRRQRHGAARGRSNHQVGPARDRRVRTGVGVFAERSGVWRAGCPDGCHLPTARARWRGNRANCRVCRRKQRRGAGPRG